MYEILRYVQEIQNNIGFDLNKKKMIYSCDENNSNKP